MKTKNFLTCTRCDRTSSFKLSKSAWVRDKAMTSAPHSTNILAVLRPIPLNKIKSCVFATFPYSKGEETAIQIVKCRSVSNFVPSLRDVEYFTHDIKLTLKSARHSFSIQFVFVFFFHYANKNILPFPAPVTKARCPLKFISIILPTATN